MSSLFPDLYDRCLAALVTARRQADVTQTELARRLGRPQSFVAKYKGRERRLDVAEFVAIAREFGADPFKILEKADGGGGR